MRKESESTTQKPEGKELQHEITKTVDKVHDAIRTSKSSKKLFGDKKPTSRRPFRSNL